MEFTIQDQAAQKFIAKKIAKIAKVKGADSGFIQLLSAIVFQDIMDHFSKQEGQDGPWAAWSKVYADHMAKVGKAGNQILADTGRLRGSFIPSNVRASSQGVLWFNPAKTAKGFPYAFAHNEGGPKLPQREFMWLSDLAKDKIAAQTLAFLEDE